MFEKQMSYHWPPLYRCRPMFVVMVDLEYALACDVEVTLRYARQSVRLSHISSSERCISGLWILYYTGQNVLSVSVLSPS